MVFFYQIITPPIYANKDVDGQSYLCQIAIYDTLKLDFAIDYYD